MNGGFTTKTKVTHHPLEAFEAAVLGDGAAGKRFGYALERRFEVVAMVHI
jgi:hypothetical protein